MTFFKFSFIFRRNTTVEEQVETDHQEMEQNDVTRLWEISEALFCLCFEAHLLTITNNVLDNVYSREPVLNLIAVHFIHWLALVYS